MFFPPFARPIGKNTNIITDREMIEAEKFFFKKIADTVRSHPAFEGIDLGNEINEYDFSWKNLQLRKVIYGLKK